MVAVGNMILQKKVIKMNDKPDIVCTAWKAVEKNTLRGFADLYFTRMHMTIKGVMLHEKDGSEWLSFPSIPQIGNDGQLIKKDGKTAYNPPVVQFDQDVKDRLRDSALVAINLKRSDSAN